MDPLWQDFRYSVRMIRKSPGFAFVAVLTLVLGIGANTAVFSIVNAVLLTPLRYPDPSRLVLFMTTAPEGPYAGASEAKFNLWRALSDTFADVTAFTNANMTTALGDQIEQVAVCQATAGFFRLFGVRFQVGRPFSEAEARRGAGHVAVISDTFWRRELQGGNAVGRTIELNHEAYAVIGVLDPTFDAEPIIGPRPLAAPDVWVPLKIDPASQNLASVLLVAGRLRPGVTLNEARSRAASTAAALRRQFPAYVRAEDGVTVESLQRVGVRDDRSPLVILFGAVTLVLLIVCANLASLMLVRGRSRTRELAMRAALGASRARIVQQLTVEGMVLAIVGTVVGLMTGRFAVRSVLAISATTLDRIGVVPHHVDIDMRVLAFTAAASLFACITFGLLPALAVSDVDLRHGISESAGGSSRNRRRLGGTLVAAEVALVMVLLIGAGLFVRTFIALDDTDPGFDSRNLIAIKMPVDSVNLNTAAVDRLIRLGQERLRALPEIRGVTAACCTPFDLDLALRYVIEGRPLTGPYHGMGSWRPVATDYFETMRIPLLRGRTFDARDTLSAPRVVVINQAMADAWWRGTDALGQRLTLGKGIGAVWDEPPRTIVGIVANVRDAALNEAPRATQYVPFAQLNDGVSAINLSFAPLTWLVRTRTTPELLRPSIEEQLRIGSAAMKVTSFERVDAITDRSTVRAAFRMWLMTSFACAALLLAAIGIYGVTAYAVGQRTREIGIRRALGAERGDVERLVVFGGLQAAFIGVAAGFAASAALARTVRAVLYGVTPFDPLVFAAAVSTLIVVAMIAAWLPARRAAHVDPMIALRAE